MFMAVMLTAASVFGTLPATVYAASNISISAVSSGTGQTGTAVISVPITVNGYGGSVLISDSTGGSPVTAHIDVKSTMYLHGAYSEPGTYEYMVRENATDGGTMDDEAYHVTVYVSASDTGLTTAVIVEDSTAKSDGITFDNSEAKNDTGCNCDKTKCDCKPGECKCAEEIEKLKEEIKDLEEQIKELKETQTKTNDQLEKLNEALTKLEKDLSDLKDKDDTIDKIANDLDTNDLDKLQEALEKLNTVLNNLQNRITVPETDPTDGNPANSDTGSPTGRNVISKKTGDTIMLFVFLGIFAVLIVVAVLLIREKKKIRKNEENFDFEVHKRG